jgi:DNA polymerase-3 subunit delta'
MRRGCEAEHLAHAYVVAGVLRGEARELAEKALSLVFCSSARRPCGTCRGCASVRDRTHPDVLWVEPQKRSRRISIEQVRSLQSRMSQTSFAGGWKACVIVGADRLSDEAANAFLKTLEEPAPRSLFLLLTDGPQFLLPTIASRCHPILLRTDEDTLEDAWRGRLLGILAEEERGLAVQAFARADRVQRLLKDIKEAAEAEIRESSAEEAEDEDADTRDARASARYREMRSALLRCMLLWYRDVLLLVCGGDERLVRNTASLESLRAKSRALSYRQALRNVETVLAMNRQLESNIAESAVLGHGFCLLAGSKEVV